MRNFTIYLASLLCLFLTKTFAQETFEDKAKVIADKIESITKDEKASLKLEIEAVNSQLESGSITAEQADAKKVQLAESRAKSIEFRVNEAQNELKDLVQQKVDGKITEKDSSEHTYKISWDPKKNRKNKHEAGESRTTSQFVFSFGATNLVTDGAVAHSDFKYLRSHYFELGITGNTRIFQNYNLLHAKYGVSVTYNTLRPTDNRIFTESGDQTYLTTSPIHQKDTHFRNVSIIVPVHLEFDFSGSEMKDDKRVFRTHDSFRVGLGGFVGTNVRTKQILEFEDYKGDDVKQKTKGDYNVTDFVYGVSAYAGWKELSLYCKYDLNPFFENNPVDQNSISLGLRWDWN